MKTTRILFPLLALCILSCHVDKNEEKQSPLFIYGNTISGTFDVVGYDYEIYNEQELAYESIRFYARPTELNFAPENAANADPLYISVLLGELDKEASPAEAFSFERITERTRPLMEQFGQYRHQLMSDGAFNEYSTRAGFINAYVTGMPSVKADDTIFGQPSGTELSEWFRFGDGCIIGVIGTDYKMEERADIVNGYQTASTYFTKERMLPVNLHICTVGIPPEITFEELPVLRYAGDDVIKVTIAIPVRFERYWDWCKALYSNPDAEERFADGEVRIVVPFVRKH